MCIPMGLLVQGYIRREWTCHHSSSFSTMKVQWKTPRQRGRQAGSGAFICTHIRRTPVTVQSKWTLLFKVVFLSVFHIRRFSCSSPIMEEGAEEANSVQTVEQHHWNMHWLWKHAQEHSAGKTFTGDQVAALKISEIGMLFNRATKLDWAWWNKQSSLEVGKLSRLHSKLRCIPQPIWQSLDGNWTYFHSICNQDEKPRWHPKGCRPV